ncbi:MAG: DUF2279 domain-containing protein [Cytophagales bacterium]
MTDSKIYLLILEFLKPANEFNQKRFYILLSLLVLGYGIISIVLFKIWYSYQLNVQFTWFDDSLEWNFIDKLGHAFSSFTVCRIVYQVFRWTGVPSDKNLISSVILSWVLVSSYEIFDGISAQYGASVFDMIANALGVSLFAAQMYFLKQIAVSFKFFTGFTTYAEMRPQLLGDSLLARIIKDYNGQVYWFNFPIFSSKYSYLNFLKISIGVGAEGLLGGHDNSWVSADGLMQNYEHITRAQRFFLSFDIEFNKIRILKNTPLFLKEINSVIKLPLPGIEFHTEKGIQWRWLCI